MIKLLILAAIAVAAYVAYKLHKAGKTVTPATVAADVVAQVEKEVK